MVHYSNRRVRAEYERQDRVRQGWMALREVARSMQTSHKNGRKICMEQYRSQLKGLLAVRSNRDHKALELFKNQAARLHKGQISMEHAIEYLILCGPNF